MTFAYTRVSTEKQSLQRQLDNIQAAMTRESIICDKVFTDKYTGTKMDRPGMTKLLKTVSAGDLIIFDSVSRMSRNAAEGVELYFRLYEMGVELRFLNEPTIDTSVFRNTQQLMMTGNAVADAILDGVNKALKIIATQQIEIAFQQSEKEVADLHKRTSDGMRAAGATNRKDADGNILEQGSISLAKTGTTVETKKAHDAKLQIRRLSKDFVADGLSDPELIELLHISRNSFYKYKAQLKAEE